MSGGAVDQGDAGLLVDLSSGHGNTAGEVTHDGADAGVADDLLSHGSGLLGRVGIVVVDQLDLLADDAALLVPLVHGDLSRSLHGLAVLGVITGLGADDSQGDFRSIVGRSSFLVGAAGQKRNRHDQNQSQCDQFPFHNDPPICEFIRFGISTISTCFYEIPYLYFKL